MPKIRIGNKSIVVTPSLLVEGVSSTVIGLYTSYNDRFGLYILGRPYALRGKHKSMTKRDTQLLLRFQEHVSDLELLSALTSFRAHITAFDVAAERLIGAAAQLRRDRPEVLRQQQTQIPPPWIDEPPYREVLLTASKIMLMIIDDVELILRLIYRWRQQLMISPATRSEEQLQRKCSSLRQFIESGVKLGYIRALQGNPVFKKP